MSLKTVQEIICAECGASLPPTAERCAYCEAILPENRGPTIEESSELKDLVHEPKVLKPSPGEMPDYIWVLDFTIGLSIILFGIVVNFALFQPDRERILADWINAYDEIFHSNVTKSTHQIASQSSMSALDLFRHESPGWRSESPMPSSVTTQILITVGGELYGYEQDLMEISNISRANVTRLNFRELGGTEDLINNNSSDYWFQIIMINGWFEMLLEVNYWSPKLKGIPVFEYRKSAPIWILYRLPLTNLFLVTILCLSARVFVIYSYRKRCQKAYNEFQERRTQRLFDAMSMVEDARLLAESGQVAKALTIVNKALIIAPKTKEVLELKRLLLATEHAGQATINVFNNLSQNIAVSESPTLLYLKIFGTPYAYLAPLNIESIVVGRQRRKPQEQHSIGSDVVIRVPGSDSKSLRVSRRHFEIRRIDSEYFVIDNSNGNTKHNGSILPYKKPVRLHSGDRLLIASVITLEVLIRYKIVGVRTSNILQVNPLDDLEQGLWIEATIGDMVTEF